MKKIKIVIFNWLPAILWMAIIFYLSSNQRVKVTGKFLFDFLIFKTLHMIEYATLYFLLFRAFYLSQNKKGSLNKRLIFPIFLAISYAVSDEVHQTLVPTREGKARDVIIDSAGVLIMYIYIKNNLNFIKKFL